LLNRTTRRDGDDGGGLGEGEGGGREEGGGPHDENWERESKLL